MTAAPIDFRAAWIDLVKRSVSNYLYLGGEAPFERFVCADHYDLDTGCWRIEPAMRPASLLQSAQLDLIETVVGVLHEQRVPGDLLEAGVWRGGAVILMRALLDAIGDGTRRVVAADSFAGIPINSRATGDPVDGWADRWVASREEVEANIRRFGMLDDRIVFLPGFFADSLPTLPDDSRFALIRLDSDSYDSVPTSLDHLYPLLSRQGAVIVDDWHLPGCRQAVEDYRAGLRIAEPIHVQAGNALWFKGHDHGLPPRPVSRAV